MHDHPVVCLRIVSAFSASPSASRADSDACGLLLTALQVGVFLQHMTTFLVGFIVAFTRGWDMTLVLVGCLPFLAAIGAVLAQLQTKLASKQTAAYTEVGAGLLSALLLCGHMIARCVSVLFLCMLHARELGPV